MDNRHTVAGVAEHKRVDQPIHEMREGARVELALPVWSHRLRLTGKCDVVEFNLDGSIRPVEYKHGKRKAWPNDDLQVAAQAVCIEEMLQTKVVECAIFHWQSRRLRKVVMTAELRRGVEETTVEIQRMLDNGGPIPPPIEFAFRCRECSLEPICQPALWKAAKAAQCGTLQ